MKIKSIFDRPTPREYVEKHKDRLKKNIDGYEFVITKFYELVIIYLFLRAVNDNDKSAKAVLEIANIEIEDAGGNIVWPVLEKAGTKKT